MKKLPLQGRTLALLAVIIPLLVLFIYVGLRSGPLAPVAVTVASVESRAITPALFGIGTVEARYTYKIGPTFAGRVKRLEVHVGDQVKAGQVLGEMEPVDGVVAVRDADPGTTIVAGQAVVEVIDPKSLWINVRFDQISASGLAGGLPAHIVLRSRGGQTLKGRVLRVEPKADAVTEETLAKVTFDNKPEPLPPVGELAEVTVDLPALPAAPLIPNAAVQREGDKVGVWQIVDGDLHFSPVKLGTSDLNGYVQVREGLKNGDQVVTYSEKALTARSRIHVVEHIPGVSR